MDNKSKKQIIQEKINLKSSMLQDIKKACRARESAMRQQVKMKNEKIRQAERRMAIDAGGTPGREYQKGSFRLYNTLVNDAKREAKAAEQELQAVLKENELNIRIIEEEIKQLRAEKTIYSGGNMKSQMIKLSKIADSFEQSGNVEAGAILTETMRKISQQGLWSAGQYDKYLDRGNPWTHGAEANDEVEAVEVPLELLRAYSSEDPVAASEDEDALRRALAQGDEAATALVQSYGSDFTDMVKEWADSQRWGADEVSNVRFENGKLMADLTTYDQGPDPDEYEERDYM